MKNLTSVVALLLAASAFATDHANMESNRPLRFDDAMSAKFGERSVSLGVMAGDDQSEFSVELKSGFAPNRHAAIRLVSADSGSGIELSYFAGVHREIRGDPALAYKIEVFAPSDNDKAHAKLRLIASKTAQRYDRIHFNIDLETGPKEGAAFILAYSKPLGVPRRFDSTFVAEVGARTINDETWFGLGIRHQADPKSVIDAGIEFRRLTNKNEIRARLGWSSAI